jgi:hypothetical protein
LTQTQERIPDDGIRLDFFAGVPAPGTPPEPLDPDIRVTTLPGAGTDGVYWWPRCNRSRGSSPPRGELGLVIPALADAFGENYLAATRAYLDRVEVPRRSYLVVVGHVSAGRGFINAFGLQDRPRRAINLDLSPEWSTAGRGVANSSIRGTQAPDSLELQAEATPKKAAVGLWTGNELRDLRKGWWHKRYPSLEAMDGPARQAYLTWLARREGRSALQIWREALTNVDVAAFRAALLDCAGMDLGTTVTGRWNRNPTITDPLDIRADARVSMSSLSSFARMVEREMPLFAPVYPEELAPGGSAKEPDRGEEAYSPALGAPGEYLGYDPTTGSLRPRGSAWQRSMDVRPNHAVGGNALLSGITQPASATPDKSVISQEKLAERKADWDEFTLDSEVWRALELFPSLGPESVRRPGRNASCPEGKQTHNGRRPEADRRGRSAGRRKNGRAGRA